MDYRSFFPKTIQNSLNNPAPGAWMPNVPCGAVRLSAGYPDPAFIPTHQFTDTIEKLIQEEHDLPFHYIGSRYTAELRQWIVDHLSSRNMVVRPTELLVAAGAFQAIDLVARILLDSSKAVVVEAPTYMEALEVFQNYTTDILSVPVDRDGLCVDTLEQMLAERRANHLQMPSLLYTIPSFQNPTGSTMPLSRRQKLLSLAEMYDFLVLEDDAYGDLFFDKAPITLKSLDQTGRVIYVGSLSKVLGPGLRIGWAVGPEPIIHAMNWFKKDLDHTFIEAAVGCFMGRIDWNARLQTMRQGYAQRRDIMLSALKEHMPDGVTWSVPDGGYFIWVHVPGVDTHALLDIAMEAGVSFIPGNYFYLDTEAPRDYLRLSFSYVSAEDMVRGIERLAGAIKTFQLS
ncbi:aminotransferase-like domain-containing protein [Alicyclobacillus dauci]|uniref:PLP-dependent aminotransferase family protein n=1 Tax=Alicyclobacillus dauci TaxID=1475485 RepID=A0ABY6Z2K8_9BACL|nr:PLP-dependent aminotransferase family protein [Alicyclobacillus dauci]WAH36753.1 PLP-dependent aminotransferase family protein [Alicyclobacillus dauci]